MTEITFEKAKMLQNRIRSIDNILNTLALAGDYALDPPTRDAGVSLFFSYGEKMTMKLNEGEVCCIIEALKSERAILQREFGKL